MLRNKIYLLFQKLFPKIVNNFEVEYLPRKGSPKNEEKYIFMLYLLSFILFFTFAILAFLLGMLAAFLKFTLIPAAVMFSVSMFFITFMTFLSVKSQRIIKNLKDPKKGRKYIVKTTDFIFPALIAGLLLLIFLVNLLN